MPDFPNLHTCSKKVTQEQLKPEDQDGSQKEVSIGRPRVSLMIRLISSNSDITTDTLPVWVQLGVRYLDWV